MDVIDVKLLKYFEISMKVKMWKVTVVLAIIFQVTLSLAENDSWKIEDKLEKNLSETFLQSSLNNKKSDSEIFGSLPDLNIRIYTTKDAKKIRTTRSSKPQTTKGPSLYQRIKNRIKNRKTTLTLEEQIIINNYSVSVLHKKYCF